MTRFSWIAMVIGLLALSVIATSCRQERKVVEKPSTGIALISIYYMGWNIETFASQSCDDLVADAQRVEIRDPARIQEFVLAVKNTALVEDVGYNAVDARVCCVLLDTLGNNVEKISFSYTSQMQINAKVYKTDQKLFDLVLSYLPEGYLKS